jgi:hypothetical protein
MPLLRIREIVDGLNELGGMTPAHMALITELVAVCLMAAGPKPHPDIVASEERRARDRERKRLPRNSTEDAVYNRNINNTSIKEGGCGGEPIPRKATRLPEDWNPSEELWSWGKEKMTPPDLRFETAAFKDYWAAKPGVAGKKLDWDKTWKTWIREAVRRRDRFKPKTVAHTVTGPKRTWDEQKHEVMARVNKEQNR